MAAGADCVDVASRRVDRDGYGSEGVSVGGCSHGILRGWRGVRCGDGGGELADGGTGAGISEAPLQQEGGLAVNV